jgi:hypothetical protein
MSDIVRGISMHSCSSGVLYYVHYDIAGTKLVEEQEFYQAVYELEEWKKRLENKEKHTLEA